MGVQKKNKGFTLVEIIVVIVVLAILVGVTIGGIYRYISQAKVNTDINNLNTMETMMSTISADEDFLYAIEDEDINQDYYITWSEKIANSEIGTEGKSFVYKVKPKADGVAFNLDDRHNATPLNYVYDYVLAHDEFGNAYKIKLTDLVEGTEENGFTNCANELTLDDSIVSLINAYAKKVFTDGLEAPKSGGKFTLIVRVQCDNVYISSHYSDVDEDEKIEEKVDEDEDGIPDIVTEDTIENYGFIASISTAAETLILKDGDAWRSSDTYANDDEIIDELCWNAYGFDASETDHDKMADFIKRTRSVREDFYTHAIYTNAIKGSYNGYKLKDGSFDVINKYNIFIPMNITSWQDLKVAKFIGDGKYEFLNLDEVFILK